MESEHNSIRKSSETIKIKITDIRTHHRSPDYFVFSDTRWGRGQIEKNSETFHCRYVNQGFSEKKNRTDKLKRFYKRIIRLTYLPRLAMVSHTTETQNRLMLSLQGCVLAVSIWCQSLTIPGEPSVISPCLKSKEASSNVSKGSSSGSRDRVDELIDKWEGQLSKTVSFSFSHVLLAGLLPEDVTYNKVAFPHQLRQ